MSVRLLVTLTSNEAAALARMAYTERRNPRDVLHDFAREGLIRRSLLDGEMTGRIEPEIEDEP
jgi:hypothetical protein